MVTFVKRIVLCLGLLVCVAVFSEAGQSTAGDPKQGKALYMNKCYGCHSVDANRVGPMHRGVFGRKAGSVPGYAYSPALKASTVVWDQTSLDKWLTDPQKLIPGQKMNFTVDDQAERADIIAYLKSVS